MYKYFFSFSFPHLKGKFLKASLKELDCGIDQSETYRYEVIYTLGVDDCLKLNLEGIQKVFDKFKTPINKVIKKDELRILVKRTGVKIADKVFDFCCSYS